MAIVIYLCRNGITPQKYRNVIKRTRTLKTYWRKTTTFRRQNTAKKNENDKKKASEKPHLTSRTLGLVAETRLERVTSRL